MNKNYLTRATSFLIAFALIVPSLLVGVNICRADQAGQPVGLAARQPSTVIDDAAGFKGRKLSPDLRHAAMQPMADEAPIRTIVQVRDPQSQNLRQLFKRYGIRVHKKLNHLQMLDAELPEGALRALADSDDVQFVSSDNRVAALGHLTTTTGAAAGRNQTDVSG